MQEKSAVASSTCKSVGVSAEHAKPPTIPSKIVVVGDVVTVEVPLVVCEDVWLVVSVVVVVGVDVTLVVCVDDGVVVAVEVIVVDSVLV